MTKTNQVQYDINNNPRYTKTEKKLLLEQYYRFERIPKTKQQRIINLLGYCKEIRNTAYPLPNSDVTTLQIVEFVARKEKDIYYINGSISLVDGDRSENRVMEAYIFDSEDKVTIYLDVTRLCVEDEPKMIRTSETFVETADTVMGISKYAGCGYFEEKIYSEEFPKPPEMETQSTKKLASKK